MPPDGVAANALGDAFAHISAFELVIVGVGVGFTVTFAVNGVPGHPPIEGVIV